MTRAKKIETFYDKYSNTVVYEYRGHRYDVEYATCQSYCVTSPKRQHEDAQRKIDELIEQEEYMKEHADEMKSIDMDEIFNLLGWD